MLFCTVISSHVWWCIFLTRSFWLCFVCTGCWKSFQAFCFLFPVFSVYVIIKDSNLGYFILLTLRPHINTHSNQLLSRPSFCCLVTIWDGRWPPPRQHSISVRDLISINTHRPKQQCIMCSSAHPHLKTQLQTNLKLRIMPF